MARLTPEEIEQGRKLLQAGNGQSSQAFAATDPRRVDIAQPPAPAAPPSALESGLRGGWQGVTAGFGDELAGAGAVVGGALNKAGIAGRAAATAIPALGALIILAGSKSKDEDFSDTYKRIRDSERSANSAAKDANPMTYGTTQVLGTILPALATGGTSAGVQGLARTGAIIGLGNSDADSIGGMAKDAATSAATNVVGGKVLQGVGTVAKAGLNKLGNSALDAVTTPGAAEAPGLIKGAVQGVKNLVNPMKENGDVDWAKLGGAATTLAHDPVVTPMIAGATAAGAGAGKAALGKAVINDVNNGGTGQIGDKVVNSAAGNVAAIPGKAAVAQAGSSDTAKGGSNAILDFVKNTFGLNTPAGQQNMPDDLKAKIDSDQTAVQEGKKDGRPTAEVPNIVTENGETFLITSSGRRVKLN